MSHEVVSSAPHGVGRDPPRGVGKCVAKIINPMQGWRKDPLRRWVSRCLTRLVSHPQGVGMGRCLSCSPQRVGQVSQLVNHPPRGGVG